MADEAAKHREAAEGFMKLYAVAVGRAGDSPEYRADIVRTIVLSPDAKWAWAYFPARTIDAGLLDAIDPGRVVASGVGGTFDEIERACSVLPSPSGLVDAMLEHPDKSVVGHVRGAAGSPRHRCVVVPGAVGDFEVFLGEAGGLEG